MEDSSLYITAGIQGVKGYGAFEYEGTFSLRKSIVMEKQKCDPPGISMASC